MKKLFAVLALGAFVACNNANTENTGSDSTLNQIDSTAEARIDSVQQTSDSLTNVIDSTAEAKKDSISQ